MSASNRGRPWLIAVIAALAAVLAAAIVGVTRLGPLWLTVLAAVAVFAFGWAIGRLTRWLETRNRSGAPPTNQPSDDSDGTDQ